MTYSSWAKGARVLCMTGYVVRCSHTAGGRQRLLGWKVFNLCCATPVSDGHGTTIAVRRVDLRAVYLLVSHCRLESSFLCSVSFCRGTWRYNHLYWLLPRRRHLFARTFTVKYLGWHAVRLGKYGKLQILVYLSANRRFASRICSSFTKKNWALTQWLNLNILTSIECFNHTYTHTHTYTLPQRPSPSKHQICSATKVNHRVPILAGL